MYARWKIRKLSGAADADAGRSMYAVLVCSERRDAGPRQKVIKHLGYINEAYLENPEEQGRFWHQVEESLRSVPIEPATRARVVARLLKVVPDPISARSPRDTDGRFFVVPEMLSMFENLIDSECEFRQLPERWIEYCDSNDLRYLISPDIFSRMNPMTRTKIRTRISLSHVQRSLSSLHRIAATLFSEPKQRNTGR